MKAKFVAPIFLVAGMAAFGNNAMASDELAGALIGAGTGAVLGHAVGGHDAAVVGGFLGAILGAAAVDNDDRDGYRRPYRTGYGQPPVAVYETPRFRYGPPPVFVAPRPAPYAWHHEWQERRDARWDHDRDGWRGDRNQRHDDRWDRRDDRHDRNGW